MRKEVYDIESYKRLFLYCGYDIETSELVIFEISNYKNEVDALVKHLLDTQIEYAISFNGLGYDAQVLQYIIENHQKWNDYDNVRISALIKKFSDRVIDDSNYGLFPPFMEEQLWTQQIDLFRIHHFDNKNRSASLKWLQFGMNWPTVEETPIPFSQEVLSPLEVEMITGYCKNDVMTTYEFYKYTIGDTFHPVYMGKNKIQDRLDLIEELGFPRKALNWSDVKIGDEINKMTYMRLTGIADERELKKMKLASKRRRRFTYKDCIPAHVEFKTKEFQEFHKNILSVRVKLSRGEKKEKGHPFTYNGTTYNIARGGIHSTEKYRIIEPGESEILRDADVGSQYPHYIIKTGLYPHHLGRAWLVGYTQTRDRRLSYKSRSSEGPKYKGLSETFKLALNGGGFGKTNDPDNWQYDPFVQYSCTIGNQFEILMLIEMLELRGIHVVSANTDGIVCLFNKNLSDTYYEICSEWEKKVGNDVHGKLEFTDYKKLIQLSVNGYLAIKHDGEVKKKKEFLTEFELNKNKSRRVLALALEKFFVDNVPVEETIRNHRNIYDFCIGVKASRKYHYEALEQSKEPDIYHRLVRYYVSKRGKTLMKVKNAGIQDNGPMLSHCEAGGYKCTVANDIDEGDHIKAYKIDYDYYIQIAQERASDLLRGKKRKGLPPDKNQLKLF